jgi:hypothetical protein
MRCEFSKDFRDLPFTDETHVARSWRRDVCVREVFRAKRVKIDLLTSKVKGVEIAFKHDMLYPKNSLIELDCPGYVAHGKDQMINA